MGCPSTPSMRCSRAATGTSGSRHSTGSPGSTAFASPSSTPPHRLAFRTIGSSACRRRATARSGSAPKTISWSGFAMDASRRSDATEGSRVRCGPIFEDKAATLWIGTQHGLGIIRDDRFVRVAAASIDAAVLAITQRCRRIDLGRRAKAAVCSASTAIARVPRPVNPMRRRERPFRRWPKIRPEHCGSASVAAAFGGSAIERRRSRTRARCWVSPSRRQPESRGHSRRAMIYRLEPGRAVAVQPRVGASYNTQVLVPDESGRDALHVRARAVSRWSPHLHAPDRVTLGTDDLVEHHRDHPRSRRQHLARHLGRRVSTGSSPRPSPSSALRKVSRRTTCTRSTKTLAAPCGSARSTAG